MRVTRYVPIAALLGSCAALAQTGGNAGASNGSQSVIQGLPPATPLPNGGDQSAGTYLSGRVAVEGGAVTPRGIAIDMVCSNFAQTVASTDTNGGFTFQWGGSANVVSDASESGHRSSSPLLGVSSGDAQTGLKTIVSCDIRANLPGYKSDRVSLSDRRVLDHTDIGVIVLHKAFQIDGAVVSSSSLNAPGKARKAYESGLKAMRAGNNDAALKDFEQAVGVYPPYANAWLELGRVRQRLGFAQTARDAWKKTIECDAEQAGAYVELGLDAGLAHDWKLATKYLDQGLRLNPVDYPDAWFGDAVAHYYLGEFDAAERSAREAVRLDPHGRNPRAGYVLGMTLARKGDREGAAAELKRYLKALPGAPDAETVKAHLAMIESSTPK